MTSKLFRAAAVAIVKNEALYIAEWLEYHALLGIEHAYIFDNNSDDDLAAVLRPYLIQGRATLLSWPGWPEQMSAYNYAIRMFGHACDWMALIDIDEFIHLAVPGTLPDHWDGLGDVDQVLMSWTIFGAGGHEARPDGLVIEAYRRRLDQPSRPVKCAVRPEAVVSAEVHHCVTRAGRTVDGDGRPVAEAWQLERPAAGTIRINHYITKSREEWRRKVARGQVDGTWYREEEFLSHQGDCLDEATAARAPAVRARLAATAAAAPGHVSRNRSPLSELTPSRRWTRQAMRRLQAAEAALAGHAPWRLAPAIDDMRLAADLVDAGAVGAAADAAFAGLIADTAALPAAPDRLGRPFLTLVAAADRPTLLATVVRGRDANGHPYRHSRRIAIAAGTTIATLILAPRTMTVEAVDCDWTGRAAGGTLRSAAYVFA